MSDPDAKVLHKLTSTRMPLEEIGWGEPPTEVINVLKPNITFPWSWLNKNNLLYQVKYKSRIKIQLTKRKGTIFFKNMYVEDI